MNQTQLRHSYFFYTVFKHIGNVATFALFGLVLREANYDFSILWWMIPLFLLVEFGCFAERDRKNEYGR